MYYFLYLRLSGFVLAFFVSSDNICLKENCDGEEKIRDDVFLSGRK